MGCTTEICATERRTICFPLPGTRNIVQNGDPTFKDEISRLFAPSENNALEELVALKSRLRQASTDEFWSEVTEGMSKILGAEMSFVMKRVLVDEQEAAVEMPPIGEPGSCVMAAALHYCAMDGTRNTIRQDKFHAFGCPCAYMRHDKVFLIPEDLNDFITDNPNQMPVPAEAYIAVPLFAEGKCFGHFGNMWYKEGAAARKLSWAFIEMLMHSLEDMMLDRFLEGSNFIRPAPVLKEKQRVIPHEAITIAQSLRPYAGSLSHELRTPMQGVVGMLDVMYATVQESIDSQTDAKMRQIFEDLKTNIEVVQDSSRRAVEAADNVVHAYDMDMSVPEVPPAFSLEDSVDSMSSYSATTTRPEILVAGSNLPLSRPNKRRRDDAFSRHSNIASSVKHPKIEHIASVAVSLRTNPEPSQEVVEGLKEAEMLQAHALPGANGVAAPTVEDLEIVTGNFSGSSRLIAPGLRHTNMREVFQYVINEGLKMGGRPDSAETVETAYGESIEVRSQGSDGTPFVKAIVWNVDPGVPQTLFIEEKDLTKLISCVFLNAIKFTDGIEGRVNIEAKMSSRGRYISIKITDNGPGIPAAFLPRLFKPFSQQNGSITRSSDGLGLGLMVAKGIARKLGGDLMCISADTEGPARGSVFEIKVPIIAGEIISRPSSPFNSPMHRRAPSVQADNSHMPPLLPAPETARSLSRALYEVANKGPLSSVLAPRPDTPPSPRSLASRAVPAAEHLVTSSPPMPPTNGDTSSRPKPGVRKSKPNLEIDRKLADKYPLTLLVAEDNKINRKLLVSMLSKLGYKKVHEAHDGVEAVRQVSEPRSPHDQIDVVLMDLWMPLMDGYEATDRILNMEMQEKKPTILAVTADVTDDALTRAAQVGMMGFMTKPYKIMDLQRLITEYCAMATVGSETLPNGLLA